MHAEQVVYPQKKHTQWKISQRY